MEEKSKFKLSSDMVTGIIIGVFSISIIIGILFLVYRAGKNDGINTAKTNNTANTTQSSNSSYNGILNIVEKEHIIANFKLKFVPSTDMLILGKTEINKYMGEGYADKYEFVAVNADMSKMLYCFIIDKTTQADYTAEQYIEESLHNTTHSEITKTTLAGIEFATTQLAHEEEGKKYIEDCYVTKQENKILCLDFWHLENQENNLAEMLQAIE